MNRDWQREMGKRRVARFYVCVGVCVLCGYREEGWREIGNVLLQ